MGPYLAPTYFFFRVLKGRCNGKKLFSKLNQNHEICVIGLQQLKNSELD
jgi:hypothetical protein